MRKLTLSLLITTLISIIGLGWGLDQLFQAYSKDSANNADVSMENYKLLGQQLAHLIAESDQPRDFIQTWNQQGESALSLIEQKNFPLPQALQDRFNRGEPLTLESERGVSWYFLLPDAKAVLSFTPKLVIAPSPNKTLSLVFTFVFYIGILLFLLVWVYPLVSRLQILRKNAIKFGHGDFSARVKPAKFSYLADIEREFNHMAQRIETLIQDNKLLGSAVSHDLRTPLARLRFGIDCLSEEHDPALRQKYQDRISQDIDEMQSLVEVLLNYARLEQTMVGVDKQPVDLIGLLNSILTDTGAIVKDVRFEPFISTAWVQGDQKYLRMLFNNLYQNALHHSTSLVLIKVEPDDAFYTVSFEDDGPGIALDQRDKVLKPFYRAEPHRGQQTAHTGYGMGLAIVDRITHWHNGTICIEKSEQLGGACFTLQLPRV